MQTQDMCVCEGVIQQVTGMTRVALHKVCLRATECVSVDLDDDDGMAQQVDGARVLYCAYMVSCT